MQNVSGDYFLFYYPQCFAVQSNCKKSGKVMVYIIRGEKERKVNGERDTERER